MGGTCKQWNLKGNGSKKDNYTKTRKGLAKISGTDDEEWGLDILKGKGTGKGRQWATYLMRLCE